MNDLRSQGVVLGQLGTLAMREGNLAEAARALPRPPSRCSSNCANRRCEAVAWHQLGMVFQEARQWDEAERHYREAARIKEERGNLAGAAHDDLEPVGHRQQERRQAGRGGDVVSEGD